LTICTKYVECSQRGRGRVCVTLSEYKAELNLYNALAVWLRDVRILQFSVRVCPRTAIKDPRPRPQLVVVCDPLSVRKSATLQFNEFIASTCRIG